MFNHILVCCDGSEAALQAAQTALSLARKQACRVTLLYVLDLHAVLPPFIGIWEGAAGPREVAHYQQNARAAVEQPVAKFFCEAGVDYQWRFAIGHPVEKITEIAREQEADLIVLGRRRHGGIERPLLGSVSDGVLHHALCSVLIVRGKNAPQRSAGFEHILFASDGSESADHAGQTALAIARMFDAPLHALHVVAPFTFEPALSEEDGARLNTIQTEAIARHYMAHLRSSIAPDSGVACTFHQAEGEAERTIVRFADEQGSDLIVMGSRGLGGFERMLLGSVSTYVAHHAHCPVLIVR